MNSTQDFTLDVHVLAQKGGTSMVSTGNEQLDPCKIGGAKTFNNAPSFQELLDYVPMFFGCVRWVCTYLLKRRNNFWKHFRYKLNPTYIINSTSTQPGSLSSLKTHIIVLDRSVTVTLEVSTKNISLSTHIGKKNNELLGLCS